MTLSKSTNFCGPQSLYSVQGWSYISLSPRSLSALQVWFCASHSTPFVACSYQSATYHIEGTVPSYNNVSKKVSRQSTSPLPTRVLLLSPVFQRHLYFFRNLECPVAAISLPVASSSVVPPVLGLNSTFLCILWLQGRWCPPGLRSSVACGLVKATTSILCTAQQAHQQMLPCCPEPQNPRCSYLCLSVSALKSPTIFHEQRKHSDGDKVIFCELTFFWT